ncbi:MAG TPA: DUF1501 domain-containing protein [Acidimicrobiia bacterium]|nr:DUF1501 domain-containing protein [Acidimicrobiia bacterium]
MRVEPLETDLIDLDDLLPARVRARRIVELAPDDRPAEAPDRRIEADQVAAAVGDVLASEPRGVSRRGFLQGVGAASTVALAGGYLMKVAAPERADALGAAGGNPVLSPSSLGGFAPNRTLVVLELSGGNDSLSMVVPYTNNVYRSVRGDVAIKPSPTTTLDSAIGLHPALTRIAGHYKAGRCAIVHGVGYPNPDLSHFDSLATWWSGRPNTLGNSGWLGRVLDGTTGTTNPLTGVTIGIASQAMMGDAAYSTTIADSAGLDPDFPWPLSRDMAGFLSAWRGMAAGARATGSAHGAVLDGIQSTVDVRSQLDGALQGARAHAGSAYPLVDQMVTAAHLIASGVAPKVIYVNNFGTFDTHTQLVSRLAPLYAELDQAVDAFLTTLSALGASDRAMLMTASEFGRRVHDDGGGADHGTVASHLVFGTGIAGGRRYGTMDPLTALDSNGNELFDPSRCVDYRAYFANGLTDWLGVDADPVFQNADYPFAAKSLGMVKVRAS